MVDNSEEFTENLLKINRIDDKNYLFGKRLDIVTLEKGFAKTRSKAKELILAGHISVNGKVVRKPAQMVLDADEITSAGILYPYVSRGGVKLEWALKAFSIDLKDLICLDVGASTGGFTHCMLLNGAAHVYALDVGHGQLAEELKADSRVTSMEGINLRTVDTENRILFPNLVDFVSIDVSFISLVHILYNSYKLLKPEGVLVALIKPQFEAGEKAVGRDGVVKSKKIHEQIINKILKTASEFMYIDNISRSPILGGDGNQEYLIVCKKYANNTRGINDKTVTNSIVRHIIYG